MGDGGGSITFFGITGPRPTVIDVVPQFEPRDGGDGSVAVQGIAVRASIDSGLVHGLFAAAKTVAAVCTELGEERGDVLRGGYGETGGAAAAVAKQRCIADVDATDAL